MNETKERQPKTKRRPNLYFIALLNAAEEAADWMLEAQEGTDQYECGIKLRAAIEDAK